MPRLRKAVQGGRGDWGTQFPAGPDRVLPFEMYYTGLSFRKAARALTNEFGSQDADVTPQAVHNWVDRYTDAAISMARDLKKPGGEMWWVFTMRSTDNKPLWRMVLDNTTGYIFGYERGSIREGDLGMMEVDGANTSAIIRNKEEVSVVQPPPDWRSALGSREFCTGYRRSKWMGDGSVQHTEGTRGYSLGLTLHKIFYEYRCRLRPVREEQGHW